MKTAQRERTTKIVLTALFSALIAVGAFLKIPIPAVPFTLQFFFANMTALFLGKKWGTLSVAIYLTLGLIGVPIFTAGGGIFYVLHPTFGYLIGFLAGNFAAGSFLERVDRSKYKNLVIAGFINAAAVYLFGLLYFYLVSTLYLGNTVTIKTLLITCFLTTFWSDTIFIFFTAFVAKKINKLLHIDYAGNLCADVKVLKRKIGKGYRVTESDTETLMNAPLSAVRRAANEVRKRSCGNILYLCESSEPIFWIEKTWKERVEAFIALRDSAAAATIRFDFELLPKNVLESAPTAATEAAPTAVTEAASTAVTETALESAPAAATETALESTSTAVTETTLESAPAAATETAQTAATKTAPTAATEAAMKSAPIAETETALKTAPATAIETASTAVTEAALTAATETAMKSASTAATETALKAAPAAATETAPTVATETTLESAPAAATVFDKDESDAGTECDSGYGKDAIPSGKILTEEEQSRLIAVCRLVFPTSRIVVDGTRDVTDLRKRLVSGANAVIKNSANIVSMDTKTLKKLGFDRIDAD